MNLRTKRGRRRLRGQAHAFYETIKQRMHKSVDTDYVYFRKDRRLFHVSREELYNLHSDWKIALYRAFVEQRCRIALPDPAPLENDEIVHGVASVLGVVTGRFSAR